MRAFLKKEWMELVRTGRLLLLLLIFILFGIMNPAIAKLTPWIMVEQLAESGLALTAVTVDAMTSWTQFYKNIPMALGVFVLLHSGIFTTEYQKGTLIPVVTKGLSRPRIAAAKTILLFHSRRYQHPGAPWNRRGGSRHICAEPLSQAWKRSPGEAAGRDEPAVRKRLPQRLLCKYGDCLRDGGCLSAAGRLLL